MTHSASSYQLQSLLILEDYGYGQDQGAFGPVHFVTLCPSPGLLKYWYATRKAEADRCERTWVTVNLASASMEKPEPPSATWAQSDINAAWDTERSQLRTTDAANISQKDMKNLKWRPYASAQCIYKLKKKIKKDNNFTTLGPYQISLCCECCIFTLVMKQGNLHSSDGDNQWQGPAKGCSADNDNTIVCIIDNMQWGLLQAHKGRTQSKHRYQLYKARNPLRTQGYKNQKYKWWMT